MCKPYVNYCYFDTYEHLFKITLPLGQYKRLSVYSRHSYKTISIMKHLNYKLSSLFMLVLLAIGYSSRAQFNVVSAYPFTPGTNSLTYITNGTTVPNILGDDRTEPNIPIGFTFYYAGVAYTDVSVCSNGWIAMGTSTSTTYSNTQTNMDNLTPILMPLFDDLTGSGSNSVASYVTTGTAPNRVFTFEWKNWSPLSSGSVDITIQVKLYEGPSNVIEFLYKNEAGSGNLSSATIGLSGTVAGDFQLLNSSGANPTVTTTGFVNSIYSTPATGQSYKWDSGPVCDRPSNLSVIGLNSKSATVTWSHPSGTQDYEYYVDNQAVVIVPTSTSRTSSNVVTVNGLSGSTHYWLHVRHLCAPNNTSFWESIDFTTYPDCVPPGGIVIGQRDTSSVSFSWSNISTATDYDYIVNTSRTSPAPGALATNIGTNNISLSNLTAGTMYYVHIRSLCAGDDSSSWMLDSFYIPRPCRAPQVTITNLSTSQGVVSWLKVLTANEYEYAVTSTPAPPALGSRVANNSVYVPYLNSGSTYYAHVRTFCIDRDVESVSPWTTQKFETYALGVGILNSSSKLISVFPNPAKDMINIDIDGGVNDRSEILLTDMAGRVLEKIQPVHKQTAININDLSSGVYLLKYSDGVYSQTVKFTKY